MCIPRILLRFPVAVGASCVPERRMRPGPASWILISPKGAGRGRRCSVDWSPPGSTGFQPAPGRRNAARLPRRKPVVPGGPCPREACARPDGLRFRPRSPARSVARLRPDRDAIRSIIAGRRRLRRQRSEPQGDGHGTYTADRPEPGDLFVARGGSDPRRERRGFGPRTGVLDHVRRRHPRVRPGGLLHRGPARRGEERPSPRVDGGPPGPSRARRTGPAFEAEPEKYAPGTAATAPGR